MVRAPITARLALATIVLAACQGEGRDAQPAERAVPVEVAAVEHGAIAAHRTFSGTLDAFAKLTIASKVAGRIERVNVDLGDPVPADETLVVLDDDELRQAVVLAGAEVKVAEASAAETENTLGVAERELARIEPLHDKGLTSDAVLDASRSAVQGARAAHEKARGGLARARATLATARIRLDYATMTAGPLEGGGTRVVAERLVNPGDTVAANTPLLTTVEIDPLIAAISVTEQDYARIAVGQRASVTTDALPERSFDAKVDRIAPTFNVDSRQARVELRIDNADLSLKPGLFARATLQLGEAAEATIVPEAALTRRGGRDGVFVLDEKDQTVTFRPVTVGIRDGKRLQVTGAEVHGRVVTLGQQLLHDGSKVVAREPAEPAVPSAELPERGRDDG